MVFPLFSVYEAHLVVFLWFLLATVSAFGEGTCADMFCLATFDPGQQIRVVGVCCKIIHLI